MAEVKIVIPSKDSPGYLRRQKRALEYTARIKDRDKQDPGLIDEMAAFLAPIVVVGEMSEKDALEYLMDNLSEAQFDQIMKALTGDDGGDKEIVPPVTAES